MLGTTRQEPTTMPDTETAREESPPTNSRNRSSALRQELSELAVLGVVLYLILYIGGMLQ